MTSDATRRPQRPHRPSAGPQNLGSGVTACTFDCYGTLIDWRAGIERHLGLALRNAGYSGSAPIYPMYTEIERGEERTYAPYRQILATTAMRVADRLGTRLPPNAARSFAESLPEWPAFPDSAEVLRELGRRGILRVILSNVDRDLLRGTIRQSGLEVDGLVTAEDVRSYKPAPAHWLRFYRDFAVERSSTLHVAHSLVHDIRTAEELGIRTVWVDRYGEELSASVHPTFVTRDLEELLRIVPRPS